MHRRMVLGVLGALLTAGSVQAQIFEPYEPRPQRIKGANSVLKGHLVDPSGKGLSGVIVLCTADGRRISTHESSSLRNGRFEIYRMLPGTYILRVDTTGVGVTGLNPPQDMTVELRKNRTTRVVLTAVPSERR